MARQALIKMPRLTTPIFSGMLLSPMISPVALFSGFVFAVNGTVRIESGTARVCHGAEELSQADQDDHCPGLPIEEKSQHKHNCHGKIGVDDSVSGRETFFGCCFWKR